MNDLQVVEMRDILPVQSARPVPDSEPYTLLITGKDFRNAFEVYINEMRSPDVVISSNTTLLAQVPWTDRAVPVRTVVIVSSRLTSADHSKLMFRLADQPNSVDGFERLVQTFLKIMFQSTGSDIFSKKVGGNLLKMAGRTITKPNRATMVSDFHLAVTNTRQQLLAIQTNDPTLNLRERLAFAKVLDARFVPSESALLGRIHIGSQAGQQSAVAMGL